MTALHRCWKRRLAKELASLDVASGVWTMFHLYPTSFNLHWQILIISLSPIRLVQLSIARISILRLGTSRAFLMISWYAWLVSCVNIISTSFASQKLISKNLSNFVQMMDISYFTLALPSNRLLILALASFLHPLQYQVSLVVVQFRIVFVHWSCASLTAWLGSFACTPHTMDMQFFWTINYFELMCQMWSSSAKDVAEYCRMD